MVTQKSFNAVWPLPMPLTACIKRKLTLKVFAPSFLPGDDTESLTPQEVYVSTKVTKSNRPFLEPSMVARESFIPR